MTGTPGPLVATLPRFATVSALVMTTVGSQDNFLACGRLGWSATIDTQNSDYNVKPDNETRNKLLKTSIHF